MRHRVHGRKLGRTSAHRKAMFRNQLTALFTHERIITTVSKAKELRPIAERMVTIARSGSLAARRRVATMVADKEIAKRLFDEIAPRFADRPGGYTRIMRLGRRHGDNAELAIIEFVDYELADHQDESEAGAKGSFLDRAKGMFGGGAAAQETSAAADEPSADEIAAAPEETADESAAVADEPVEADEPKAAAADDAAEADEAEAAAAESEAVEEAAPSADEAADDTAPEDEEKDKA